jgi:ketosteroid isomerase-like protein
MTEDLAAAVRAAERKRAAAMLANDTAALDALLDARLQFCHSTGNVDDKASYMAKLATGRLHYTAIQWQDDVVTALGPDAAIIRGRMHMDVRVEGTDKHLNNRVITVWSRTEGEWRLVAFQSTPLPS